MGIFKTTMINNKVKVDDVDLHLTISQEGNKLFDLKGKIKIYNVFDVVKAEDKDKPSVRIKKTPGADPSDFKYNSISTQKYHYFDTADKELSSFEIIIKGKIKEDFQSSAELKMEIPTGSDSFEPIIIKVVKDDKSLIIDEFKANNYIVQEGKHTLELSYKIGEDKEAEWTLFENNEVWKGDISKSPIAIGFGDRNKLSGLYEYALQGKKGDQMVCKKINILYVQETEIKQRLIPDNKTIINFCAAQNEDYLYTLMSSKEEGFEIGYTHQIDGKNTWAFLQIKNQETIKLFATSPMVHLQSDDEKNASKLGRILFIGGSKIGKIQEAAEIADKVAIIDLGNKSDNIDLDNKSDNIQVPTKEEVNLPSKFGHTCVLFPTKDNPNTIWLMGGQDEYGTSTNDIWTSSDGKAWTQQETPPWSARCMLSASVSWKYEGKERKKEALWLGGGFKDFAGFDGGFKNDVWRWDKNKWEQINLDAKIPPENRLPQKSLLQNSLACGIAYGGLQKTGDIGVFIFGKKQKESAYFLSLNKNNNNENVLDNDQEKLSIVHFNQGVYITAFFSECMWVMGVCDEGSKGIYYSNLYYRIPTIHGKTINFYNNNNNNQ